MESGNRQVHPHKVLIQCLQCCGRWCFLSFSNTSCFNYVIQICARCNYSNYTSSRQTTSFNTLDNLKRETWKSKTLWKPHSHPKEQQAIYLKWRIWVKYFYGTLVPEIKKLWFFCCHDFNKQLEKKENSFSTALWVCLPHCHDSTCKEGTATTEECWAAVASHKLNPAESKGTVKAREVSKHDFAFIYLYEQTHSLYCHCIVVYTTK